MNSTKEAAKSIYIIICLGLIIVQICFMVKLHSYEELLSARAVNEEISQGSGASDDISNNQADSAKSGAANVQVGSGEKVIILDPGHGKSSSMMSDEEKGMYGWATRSDGSWGEWRHWVSGTMWHDCTGSGCNGLAPKNGGCWYPIENGDRNGESEINLRNAQAAERYLTEMGYTVRMTRQSNDENPSITMRLQNCYPKRNINEEPDALVYVCIHSNAGGGRGSAYLSLSSGYDQAGISPTYVEDSNLLGSMINDRIVNETGMGAYTGGRYDGQPYLILFHKSPVPVGYMEIGFFDSSSDLAILESESDAIGRAIANGINDYITYKGL